MIQQADGLSSVNIAYAGVIDNPFVKGSGTLEIKTSHLPMFLDSDFEAVVDNESPYSICTHDH